MRLASMVLSATGATTSSSESLAKPELSATTIFFVDAADDKARGPPGGGGTHVYDWAALVPVARGAGGVITDWAGAPLGLHNDGRVVLAGDARMHRAALDILNG